MPKWLIEDPSRASKAELLAAARAAAKTANQRLVRLEKAVQGGSIRTENTAYNFAMNYLAEQGRRRYRERVSHKMTRNAILREYQKTLEFLGAKSSTLTGLKSIEKNRYLTYKSAGYTGSLAGFKQDMARLWSSDWAKFGYSSEVVYQIATSGKRSDIKSFVSMLNDERERAKTSPGKLLIQTLKNKGS